MSSTTSWSMRLCQGTGIDAVQFWSGFAADRKRSGTQEIANCCKKRDAFQEKLDDLLQGTSATPDTVRKNTKLFSRISATCCRKAMRFPSPRATLIRKLPLTAGPQLVVPVMNARYALNAANARWGSLVRCSCMARTPFPKKVEPKEARRSILCADAKVIAWAKAFLDDKCAS